MQIRRAGPSDVDACLGVQRRSAVIGYAHIFDQEIHPFPDEIVRTEWEARLASEAEVLLAVDGAEPVGTVSTRPPRLEALFVVPERWGSGLAGQLHDAALARVRACGCAFAELDVMVDNARARRFYERLGWRPDGRVDVTPWPPYPKVLGYRHVLAAHATIES
jgi:GNAT superfamily N-acetyltransferase